MSVDRPFRFGTVAVANLDEIAQAIRDALAGHLHSSAVANHDGGYMIEVRTDQTLRDVRVWRDDKETPPRFGGIHLYTTYGLSSIGIGAYVSLSRDNEVRISQQSSSGNELRWTFAAQRASG